MSSKEDSRNKFLEFAKSLPELSSGVLAVNMDGLCRDPMRDKNPNLHTLFQKFVKEVDPFGEGDSEYHCNTSMISRIEKFMAENPEVKMSYCDDDHHMSAYMIWIPHYCDVSDYYMGVTVLGFAQTYDDDVVVSECFLYPAHLDSLLECANHFAKFHDKNPMYGALKQLTTKKEELQ